MFKENTKNILKPEKPKSDECCGGGSCCPCVWDTYKEKLKKWQLTQPQIDTVN
ncbi:oxidoreductase-like domain-containing protein [Pseudoalteromonas sp. Bsw20308]|uniref:oxidoreductase-like domain-containing protein n=1 Tax=Pseudoalteromonas sp. Bsw20308 TaxID=283699 RepID=UPI0002AA8CF4|nr:oxidoreductase-like domain-containing protein [Pseudoalteromonas sp. Bsw20308]